MPPGFREFLMNRDKSMWTLVFLAALSLTASGCGRGAEPKAQNTNETRLQPAGANPTGQGPTTAPPQ
jgi:hypothetical protein